MWKALIPLVGLFIGSAALVAPTQVAHAQDETDRADWLDIELGKSIVIETPRIPRAIAVTNPGTADVIQLGGPTKWQVQGKSIGTTDLVIQFGGDVPPMIYEITVHQDLSDLIRRVGEITEGNTPPRIYPLNERVVVEGPVSDLDTLERVAMVAQMFDPEFVNLMTVSGDHQVQLEVIYAEVSRNALKSMGINVLWNQPALGAGLVSGGIGQTPLIGSFAESTVPMGTGFNLYGVVGRNINVTAVLSMLDQYGLAKVLAQPTLVALSGQKAEMLSGAEVPIVTPVNNGNVQVRYRTFGTQMSFVPTVLANDLIDIQLDLEISQRDDSVSANLRGISVPGFSTRQVRGHIRLRSGMTFALAGLLSERTSITRAEFPGLGRIPVLGALFRTITHNREEQELMVYVTPRLVRPMAPGEVPPILGTTENNNPSDLAIFLLGATRRAGSRTASPTGEVGLHR